MVFQYSNSFNEHESKNYRPVLPSYSIIGKEFSKGGVVFISDEQRVRRGRDKARSGKRRRRKGGEKRDAAGVAHYAT